jgi:hypothetical protein
MFEGMAVQGALSSCRSSAACFPQGERQTVVPQSTQVRLLTGWWHENHSTFFTPRLCHPVEPCSSAVVSGTHDLLLANSCRH